MAPHGRRAGRGVLLPLFLLLAVVTSLTLHWLAASAFVAPESGRKDQWTRGPGGAQPLSPANGLILAAAGFATGQLQEPAVAAADGVSPQQLVVPMAVLGVLVTGFIVSGVLAAIGAGGGRAGFMTAGEVILDLPMSGGGDLQVTSHQDRGADEEWRVLRFLQCKQYCQAVTKVRAGETGLLPGVLALPYNRTLVSVVLATLEALGAPVLAAARKEGADVVGGAPDAPLVRILCIGLGGGSVPSFFASVLPRAQVDVVELEPAVVQAATEAMGFSEGPRLRVVTGDGAAFAEDAASAPDGGPAAGVYDAVVVDAYDTEGNVPEVMWSSAGGVAKALSKGLLREPGLVAVNFLPGTNLFQRLSSYQCALQSNPRPRSSGASFPGAGFSIEAEEGNLMAVQPCCSSALTKADGEDWRRRIQQAGRDLTMATGCAFDMATLATSRFQVWE